MLPDLLRCSAPGTGPPEAWAILLARTGFAVDHIDDGELPPGPDLAAIMAEDAWRIAQWLELVTADELTEAGRFVAQVAETPPRNRTEEVWRPAIAVLAAQVRECYLGTEEQRIVDLVQEGATTLKEPQDPWTAFCPGLLLPEIEALLNLANTNAQEARGLIPDLMPFRREAMRDYNGPVSGVDDILNMSIHADAVSGYYLNELDGYINPRALTLTAAQATVILFVFCGLLTAPKPHLPVQYLVVSDG